MPPPLQRLTAAGRAPDTESLSRFSGDPNGFSATPWCTCPRRFCCHGRDLVALWPPNQSVDARSQAYRRAPSVGDADGHYRVPDWHEQRPETQIADFAFMLELTHHQRRMKV